MERCYFTKAALIFAFGLSVHGSTSSEKAGKCPKVFNTHIPALPCVNDGCCPGPEKCCKFPGGNVCAPPILISAQPGCPDTKGQIGVCAELCSCDSDCREGEKCCFNGCGHECTGTKPEKPGSCGSPWHYFWCSDNCHHDSDCPGHLKCCRSFWGHICQEPFQHHYH